MENEKGAVQAKEFNTALTNVNNTFFPLIKKQIEGNGINMDQYTRQCVISALSAINNVLDAKGISWNDSTLDKSSITESLLKVAALKLNSYANPREVYFTIRNAKQSDGTWKKQVEMGIEGDGNDAILARFGRDIKKVGQFWLVREGDDFEYPTYNGFDVIPPKWTPKGKGNVVRVVYPIMKTDGTLEFHIAEREDVAKNLYAHIQNNLMNETFGICESRYKASAKQLEQINAKKQEILKKAKELGLDALDDEELQKWISPAWTDYQSRENMIIRKMRNNVVKKIPKDFGNAYIEMQYSAATDEKFVSVQKEIRENANKEVMDIEGAMDVEYEDVPPENPETEQEGPDF
jgi:hypothetical protein